MHGSIRSRRGWSELRESRRGWSKLREPTFLRSVEEGTRMRRVENYANCNACQIRLTFFMFEVPTFRNQRRPQAVVEPALSKPGREQKYRRGIPSRKTNASGREGKRRVKRLRHGRLRIIGRPLYRIVWLGYPSAYEERQQGEFTHFGYVSGLCLGIRRTIDHPVLLPSVHSLRALPGSLCHG